MAVNGTQRPAPVEEGPDPFDPESLRLPPDLGAALGVKRILLTVPVRKPAREWFVRVHSDPAYHLSTAVIELKEAGEIYLVEKPLWPDLAGETTFSPRLLFLTSNRQGTVFFWPIRTPSSDGRVDHWSKSALEAAEFAMRDWVRVQADINLGAYSIQVAEHSVEPRWPDASMRELLRIAFRDRYVDSLTHPVLRQLRGEV
jgi:hypothetical protein